MVLEQYILWPTGLWALLGIIPLLLLYLLKPKPRKQTLPSLMFLLGERGKKSRSAMLWYLLSDLLFFLQLVILIMLAVTIAQPYLLVSEQAARDNTVIVLDNSASMHAPNNDPRWQEAQDIALENVGSTNTLILAGGVPEVVLQEASASETRDYLRSWRPSEQASNLGRAALRARDAAAENSRVLIISDFIETDQSTTWQKAVSTLQARGIAVTLRQVGTPAQNIGIVDAVITETTTTVFVKNYLEESRTVPICAASTCEDLQLDAYETTQWQVATPAGITRIELDVQDDYEQDNSITVSMPTQNNVRILIVSNGNVQETALWYALETVNEATPLNLEIQQNKPPQLVGVDHDIIIYTDVQRELLVSRVVRNTIDRVEEGAAAIIIGQEDVFDIPYEDLLALSKSGEGGATTISNTQQHPGLVSIDYGDVTSHHQTELTRNAEVLATAGGNPIITLHTLGQGRVLYYGLDPETSTFALNPQYPVFWKRTLDILLARPSAASLNKKTGELISAQTIITPDEEELRGTALLNQQGIYRTDNGAIAANTLNAQESDLNPESLEEDPQYARYVQTDFQEPKIITEWFIYAILALLFIELLYVKWRGDA